MAVITGRTYRWATLAGVDLLESGDEREPVSLIALARRLPPWAVAPGLVAVLLAGLVAAVDQRREAARPDVAVRLLDARSSTVAGVARGSLALLLVNRRDRPARLAGLVLEVEGLQVTALQPAPTGDLGAYGEQQVRVTYTIPSCAALVLPGTLVLQVDGEQERVAVVEAGSDSDGIELGSCPPSARSERPGEDAGARAAGGTSPSRRGCSTPARKGSYPMSSPSSSLRQIVISGAVVTPTSAMMSGISGVDEKNDWNAASSGQTSMTSSSESVA